MGLRGLSKNLYLIVTEAVQISAETRNVKVAGPVTTVAANGPVA